MAASSDSTIATPPAGGAPRRHPDLPPHIVDRVARESPDTIYGLWPIEPTSYDAGFRTITYAQLANVVNGLAWWIEEHLGPGRSNQMLTYVGPNDFRVSALVLASIKAGYGVGQHDAMHAILPILPCLLLLPWKNYIPTPHYTVYCYSIQ